MDQIYLQPDSLCTGLQASDELDHPIPALRVTWIEWDSGFRDSGLRIGDRIIAVAGQRLRPFADAAEAGLRRPQLIGQYAESQGFSGGHDGDALLLGVRRRRIGGRGWQELQVSGQLRLVRGYRDEQNRPILGPGGPIGMEYDGFFESWNSFHENLRRKLMGMVDLESRTNPLFVEVTEERGPAPGYAGEGAASVEVAAPADDAEPEVVLGRFFAALKYGQQKLWSSLYASFELSFTTAGRPIIDPSWESPQRLEQTYEHARGVLLSKIYDMVIRWVDEPRTVVSGDEFPDAPRIDETTVWSST